MNSIDSLRIALAKVLYYGENDEDRRSWEQADEVRDYYVVEADNVLKELADPKHRLEILQAMKLVSVPLQDAERFVVVRLRDS